MKLSVNECIGFGWRTFKARPWFFVQVALVLVAVSILSGMLQGGLHGVAGTGGSFLSFLISLVIDTFVSMGVITVYLRAHDSVMSPTLKDLWQPTRFWPYLGASILLCIIVGVGYILLIVPGIILTVALAFATILVIDKKLAPVAALKESARLTRGHRWQILLLVLAIVGINLLGLIALVVGLIVSVPVSILAMIHAYRQLSGTSTPAAPIPLETRVAL